MTFMAGRDLIRLLVVVSLLVAGIPLEAGSQTFSRYHDLVMREPHVTPADHRIYYGTNLVQFGDLRLPKGPGPHPVAIVIHGGAWGSAVALHYMAPLSVALTCAGVATWNIEYRRIGGGGGWPATFQDVGLAADFLRELALRVPLDLTRVVATGHSAGGHLVLWLVARHRLPSNAVLYTRDPLPLRGVVPLAGPPDLARFIQIVPRFTGAVTDLLGGQDNMEQNLAEGSPAELRPLGVPQIFINGEEDLSVPLEVIEDYLPVARAAGDDVRLIPVPGGHFESVDPALPLAGPAIRDSVLSLLGTSASGGVQRGGACPASQMLR
jgi:acetyl esterase/lipase